MSRGYSHFIELNTRFRTIKPTQTTSAAVGSLTELGNPALSPDAPQIHMALRPFTAQRSGCSPDSLPAGRWRNPPGSPGHPVTRSPGPDATPATPARRPSSPSKRRSEEMPYAWPCSELTQRETPNARPTHTTAAEGVIELTHSRQLALRAGAGGAAAASELGGRWQQQRGLCSGSAQV